VAKALVPGQFIRRLKPTAKNEKQAILLKFIAVPFKERGTKQTSDGFSRKIGGMLLNAISPETLGQMGDIKKSVILGR